MISTRSIVRTILYGAGTHRRFTQDGPVTSDVWSGYLDDHGGRLKLLIEPWDEMSAACVAEEIRTLMEASATPLRETRLVYNRITVAADLTLWELVANLLPLTAWYVDAAAGQDQAFDPKGAQSDGEFSLPSTKQMWEDVIRSAGPPYRYPQLLAFVRIAGVIAYLTAKPEQESKIERQATELRRLGEGSESDSSERAQQAEKIRMAIAKAALIGWRLGLKTGLPAPSKKLIFAVYRNRPATLAMHHSLKTVKADAAAKLFTIQSKDIAWAVIDSGVDALHPAFLDRSKVGDTASEDDLSDEQKLKYSRVVETYDFTHLSNLLLRQDIPAHYMQGKNATSKRLDDIETRIRRSQNIDWELLRPFLKISHDKNYVRPQDGHGTHVAGILGANWPRPGSLIAGMCPDIRLIDIRVCRNDGSSDEFIIISALQFLRYLNSISDEIYIHGANMSLSIPCDISAFGSGQTLVCTEANRTVLAGIVVVSAAGNSGHRRVLGDNSDPIEEFCPISITDPGNAELVITVGSTHRIAPHTYGVSYFSSRGPTGDGRIKPDLLAPGEKIMGLALDSGTTTLEGTSMAAPHVSGAAAMLMARHRELRGRPERIKQILCATATDLLRERYFQGYGLVDVLRALQSV